MSTYAIGDVQGCFSALQKLLDVIHFSPTKDTLWFTGDLVNRGAQSLETLRFIKNLGSKHRTVLGNHDLHLLALAHGSKISWPDDTLTEILAASDRDELIHWLCQQPLLHYDEKLEYAMIHAGLAASWDLETAKRLAHEVESILKSDQRIEFFNSMYGNYPDLWDEALTGMDRLRCITNYFTRARFCYPDGRLELKTKGKLHDVDTLIPWFKLPERRTQQLKIIFGHWAALGGVTNTLNVYALDTGCIWGYALTAMRLDDRKIFSTSCGV